MQKAIGDLKNYKFFIPFYQRGYKWERKQIEELLNDLWEFYELLKKEKKDYKYYSLQPLVVKKDKENNRFIVVDGQQRLTTIYLILSAMEEILNENIDKFEIEYERDGSKEFLENIKKTKIENDINNVDFYYMYNGYQIIKEWIKEKNITLLREFKNFILTASNWDNEEQKDLNKNIRFIWYEIKNDKDDKDEKNKKEVEFDAFIRLNIGKIPLTNAELIKSFLIQKTSKERREESKTRRKEIANEWDSIEYELANNEFFGFLTTKNYKTRIELLFQVLVGESYKEEYQLYEKFLKYFENYNDDEKSEKIWKEIKNIFYTLKFWYENREFYHLIGYLISSEDEENIIKIYKSYNQESKNKMDFKSKLKKNIETTLRNKKQNLEEFINSIDELSYGSKKLTKIFLLFNVLTLINSSKDSYIKFSFYKFNNEKWSIEHITPQTDKKFLKKIKTELDNIKDKLNNEELNKILEKENLDEKDTAKLEKIFSDEKISQDKDNIRNLTLLSFGNNSSLSNNFFPVKRSKIIEMDKKGEFIPIVTKNLFLKYYSGIDGNPEKWSFNDGENYINELKNSFVEFFKGKENE